MGCNAPASDYSSNQQELACIAITTSVPTEVDTHTAMFLHGPMLTEIVISSRNTRPAGLHGSEGKQQERNTEHTYPHQHVYTTTVL